MYGIRHKKLGRSFYEECLDASSALAAGGFGLEDGYLLAVYPFVRRNPFLRMLYSADFDKGFATSGIEKLEHLNDVPSGLNVVVHYHWIHRVFDHATNAHSANQQVTEFLGTIQRQKDAGQTIMWTVHNILSHGSRFPEEEAKLRADFAGLVDHIHIMNPATRALCAGHYNLPADKIFEVPHPSYYGVYGDYVSKSQARFSFGLQPDDKVFLLFGGMGPFKGTHQFLSQMDALQSAAGGKARVVIAGQAGEPAYMEDLFQLTAGRADVQFHLGHVSDRNVQNFFRAADVAVCAHPSGLNSGVANTAVSFGKPVVLAHDLAGTLSGIEDYIFRFDPEDTATCTQSCVAALAVADQSDCVRALTAWAQAMAPQKMSARFFDALRARL